MSKDGPKAIIIILVVLDLLVGYFVLTGKPEQISVTSNKHTSNQIVTRESIIEKEKQKEEIVLLSEEIPEATLAPVYDNLTLEQLTAKLERNLGSTLKGYGSLFALYSVELGIDPYLALAITLQETGCKWNCSKLVKECNNVGGMKGSPGCGGGSYKSFTTLEEGIKSYLDNIYYNYYRYGLTTPETMNAKYAENGDWSIHVRSYMNQIKAS